MHGREPATIDGEAQCVEQLAQPPRVLGTQAFGLLQKLARTGADVSHVADRRGHQVEARLQAFRGGLHAKSETTRGNRQGVGGV